MVAGASIKMEDEEEEKNWIEICAYNMSLSNFLLIVFTFTESHSKNLSQMKVVCFVAKFPFR